MTTDMKAHREKYKSIVTALTPKSKPEEDPERKKLKQKIKEFNNKRR